MKQTKHETAKVAMRELLGMGLMMVILGIALALSIDVNDDIQDDLADCADNGPTGVNGEALSSYNSSNNMCHNATNPSASAERPNNDQYLATRNGTMSVNEITEKLPTMAVVVVASAIILALLTLMGARALR